MGIASKMYPPKPCGSIVLIVFALSKKFKTYPNANIQKKWIKKNIIEENLIARNKQLFIK
jgi:hypothetical protein